MAHRNRNMQKVVNAANSNKDVLGSPLQQKMDKLITSQKKSLDLSKIGSSVATEGKTFGAKATAFKKGENVHASKTSKVQDQPVENKPKTYKKPDYAAIHRRSARDYENLMKKEGWSIPSSKMVTYHLKEAMRLEDEARNR